jgi:branched-chain amino acid transport system ATP-binding protein
LLLLDEPSRGLSAPPLEEIFGVIRGDKGKGTTILFAEQNARAAMRLADYGYVLETGSVAREGTTQELLKDATERRPALAAKA